MDWFWACVIITSAITAFRKPLSSNEKLLPSFCWIDCAFNRVVRVRCLNMYNWYFGRFWSALEFAERLEMNVVPVRSCMQPRFPWYINNLTRWLMFSMIRHRLNSNKRRKYEPAALKNSQQVSAVRVPSIHAVHTWRGGDLIELIIRASKVPTCNKSWNDYRWNFHADAAAMDGPRWSKFNRKWAVSNDFLLLLFLFFYGDR